MKRNFTFLIAAFALLVFMMPTMVGWGQTRTTETFSYTAYSGQGTSGSGSQCTATQNGITITSTKGYGADAHVREYSGSDITVSGATITKIEITCTANNTSNYGPSKLGIPSGGSGNYGYSGYVGTWTGDASTVTLHANAQCRWTQIVVTYSSGGTTPTYTVTYDANGGTGTMTDSNSPYNAGATVTVMDNAFTRDNYTFDHWNTSADDSGTDYDEGDTFTINANTTLYAQWTENTPPTPVGDLIIDFESTASTYTDWTFTNMTSKQTGSITAHGGTYYGVTGNGGTSGTATASVVTKTTIATPGSLTCYVSKQSTNSTSSTWYIQVSSDGSTWTDVASRSATDMNKGEWKEFTADLSAYTNVYVRVYYSGSTAIRNIDDLTLTTSVPSVAAPVFTPASGTEFGNDGLSVTISCATTGASIYYTLDGSTPDNNSTLYEGAITLTTTATINAIAYDGTNYSTVATATYTYVDPNAPGTVNNPYTVAQARAAIDAGTGTQGVYVTGIVCTASPQLYNNKYLSYYISDDGTETTRLEAYNGLGLNQANFTSVDDVEVGATVVIYGNLIKYSNTYELAANNYLVSYTAPVHAVEAPTFSPAAGTYTSAQTVTLSCETSGASIYYTTDGSEPDNTSTEYTTALTISATTTIKAIAYDGTNYSNVTTATYHFCSAEDPYTVTEALAFNEYPANNIYVSGIVSTAPTSNPSSGKLTYYISVDGEATNELEVFLGKGLNNTNFSSKDDIQVGDIVTIYGNVVIYGTTNPIKEFAQGNYLVSFERPTAPAQEYTLTVGTLSHVNLFIFGGDESETIISTADGETTAQVYDGTEVLVSINVEEGYLFQSLTVTDANGDPVEVEVLTANDLYSFVMPASNVTITATAIVAPAMTTYTLATSIESGKQYIIVGQDEGVYYAMGAQGSNNREGVVITVNGTTASATIANTSVHEFTISSLGTENHYSIMDATTSEGYLYAASSSKNYLRTESALDENGNGNWEIIINSGTFSVVASGTSTNKYMRFNNAQDIFACYGSAGSQHPVFLYVKDETPVTETYTLDITGYTDVTEGTNNDGYYLIASPVTVDPATVDGMTTGDFDLYYFDNAQDLEWINYEGEDGNFNLVPGKGYLYAKKATTQGEVFHFSLTGTPYSGNGEVELTYSTTNQDENMRGWNLVGNPFGVDAYIAKPCYTLENGNAYTSNTAGTAIHAMQGLLVVADEDGETLTFSTTAPAPGKSARLALNLSQGQGLMDRAIVCFNESQALPKLQFRDGSTKIYIPVDGKDYAVVSADNQGEMPFSFKAENNGTYTLSFNAEDVTFGYLHLIDNMTGNDVDLLSTPSYTFEAKTTDYYSRFKLVFATGTADDTFAFFSNGSFVINNEGNATLQVIDVNGRIIRSESINGCANVNVNAANGVYMLRLVNGNDVKTQKIIVK